MAEVGPKARELIVNQEIGGTAYYNKCCTHPVWPKGMSGVTWGIGYDGGQHTAAQIRADWSAYLSADDVETLAATAGIKGAAAAGATHDAHDVTISLEVATKVFDDSTLPRYAAGTSGAMANCDALPPDAFGALVSISYNRGWGGWTADGDRYSEMNDIADSMSRGAFSEVSSSIDAMKRHWDEDSVLYNRRIAEAALFKGAIAAAGTADLPATS